MSEPARSEPAPLRPPALPELRGDLSTNGFGRLKTLLLALCGVLFVLRAARLFARWFLGRRVTVVVTLGQSGLHLAYRTSVLGKLRRDGELLVPLHNLSRIERSVRYNGGGFYTGALALCSGTFVGATLMLDSLRATPVALELFAWGSLLVGASIVLDFLLVTAFDSARGKCLLRVVTKDGLRLTVGSLDPPLVDGLLEALTAQLEQTALQTGAPQAEALPV